MVTGRIAYFSKALRVLWLAMATLLIAPVAQAQNASVDLSADLPEAEFQAMLGRLSDENVRDILIAEFAARRTEEAVQSEGLLRR